MQTAATDHPPLLSVPLPPLNAPLRTINIPFVMSLLRAFATKAPFKAHLNPDHGRHAAAASIRWIRWMSVINLSDESAVEKFRQLNAKSILYFTATWSVLGNFNFC